MLKGIKTCTSRTKCYGKIGDTFQAFDKTFQFTRVETAHLESVAAVLFREEGCRSPAEFMKVWKGLHPRKGWDGWQKVWVHHFRMMQESGVAVAGPKSVVLSSSCAAR